MFDDARKVPPASLIEADLCVVGAGAAGITLALELSREPLRICLLESGGLTFDRATQALAAGESVGASYFPIEETRYLGFGGSTAVWAGWCRPLDPIDFEVRPWVPHSGWPFDRAHLNPFYERAHRVCELGPYLYDPEAWEAPGARRLPLGGGGVAHGVFHVSRPTKFGAAFRARLAYARDVRVLLHANAVELELCESGSSVERVRVRTLSGNAFEVSARAVVLAAGGIENARLLLISGSGRSGGVGNSHGNVGRFFLEHPFLDPATFHPADPHLSLAYYFPRPAGRGAASSARVRGVFSLEERIVREERLLNCAVFFRPRHEAHPAFGTKGVKALLDAWEVIRGRAVPPLRLRPAAHVLREADQVAVALYRKLLGTARPVERWRVRAFVESEPNPDSRVSLTDSRDRLGRRGVRLDWRLGPNEMRSLRRALELLDRALRRGGVGHLEISLPMDPDGHPSLTGGKHHIGTTRMSRHPESGVVDEDCLVHGMSNLFVAGSSVFPTPGYANPTLTIVALAIRLAERLRLLLRDRAQLVAASVEPRVGSSRAPGLAAGEPARSRREPGGLGSHIGLRRATGDSDGPDPAEPVTLCIVNYQGASSLPQSLAAAAWGARFAQILLVDNNSTDGGLELVRSRFPEVEILPLARNGGPGTARNAGFRAASHDLVLFADNDVVLGPGCERTLLRALRSDLRALAAMPSVRYRDEPERVQYDAAGSHYLGTMALHRESEMGSRAAVVREINSLVTACFLIDRSRWSGGPLFDETFFMFFEDHDFALRARLSGHVLLSVPSALCYHGHGTPGLALRSTGAYHPLRVICTIRNRWQMLLKDYEARTLLVLAPALLAYEAAQLAVVVRKGWGGHWLRALGWIFANLPGLARRRRIVQLGRTTPDREILEGGPLPLAPEFAAGRIERAAQELVSRAFEAYWRVARGWL